MPLFTAQQLGSWLQYPSAANVDRTTLVEQVVTGWLLGAAEADTLPDPLPPQLFAWALELAGIAYENPTSLTMDVTGSQTSTWSRRRDEILEAVRGWAHRQPNGPATSPAGALPAGSFPDPQCYPDPARTGRPGGPARWYAL